NGWELHRSMKRHGLGQLKNIMLGGDDFFGIASCAHASHDSIAGFKMLDLQAAFNHDPRDLGAGDKRGLPSILVLAIDDEQVGKAYSDGVHFDAYPVFK